MEVENLAGLSSQSRALCERLLDHPLLELSALRERNREYLLAVEAEADEGAFIDLPLAQKIGGVLDQLLEAPADAGLDQHRALQLAVLYFEQEDDAEPDVDSVLGFEDDAHVVNAVLRFLGRDDLLIDLP